jgi:sterol 3beta-glucosyltransferase
VSKHLKICILSYGSRGDVQPYAALALGLRRRGHAVTLAAPSNYEGFCRALGLDYARLEGDTVAALEDPSLRSAMLRNDMTAFFKLALRVVGEEGKRSIWAQAMRAAEGAQAVLCGTVSEYWAHAVAEKLGIPLILSELAPLSPTSAWPAIGAPLPPLGPFNRLGHLATHWAWWRINARDLNRLRGAWGLPALSRDPLKAARAGGSLVLHAHSPALAPAAPDWGANHATTGAWRFAPGERGGLDGGDASDPGFIGWLENGVPPVYLSFGSLPVLEPRQLIELAGDLCEALNLRAVVSAAGIEAAMADCELPDGVAATEAVDHDWLFPQCSAVFHHAGAGTTHAALHAGVPQLPCPVFADQHFWAGRVQTLGLGVALPFKKLSLEGLVAAAELALGEACQAAAAERASLAAAENGVKSACLAIEGWFEREKNP